MALKNNKALGQHWLKDRAVLDEIAELAYDDDARLCLEIGPGLGTLTSSLFRNFEKVLVVEYDARLAENLPKSFPGKNLEVIHADFLDFDFKMITEPYVVAGNIPYYITSPIILKLIRAENLPRRIVLLIQKEVAERIVAGAGKHTVISLTVQNSAYVELGAVVPRELFTPAPKVDSQIIILEPHAPIVSEDVIGLIKRGFLAPRKKLISNLSRSKSELMPIFERLGISSDARPADLELQTWQELWQELENLR